MIEPALNSAHNLIDVGEAARILGVSASSLRRLEQNGQISSTRTSSGIRKFDIKQVEALRLKLESSQNERKAEIARKRAEHTYLYQNAIGQKNNHSEAISSPTPFQRTTPSTPASISPQPLTFSTPTQRHASSLPLVTGFSLGTLILLLTLPLLYFRFTGSKQAEKPKVLSTSTTQPTQAPDATTTTPFTTTDSGVEVGNVTIEPAKAEIYPTGGDNKSLGTSENPWRSIFAKKFTLDKFGKLFLSGGMELLNGNLIVDDSLKIRDNVKVEDNTTLGQDITDLFTVNATSTFNGDVTINNNLTVGGTTIVNGVIDPGFTQGSVIFQGSTGLAQNNSNFFWDDTNNRLGLGTTTPTTTLDVNGTAHVSGNTTFDGNTTLGNAITDTITFTGRQASHLLPITASLYNLGSALIPYANVYADNIVATSTDISGTKQEYFTIDSDNTGGELAIVFGQTNNERLTWNAAGTQFEFSDELQVGGNMAVTGNITSGTWNGSTIGTAYGGLGASVTAAGAGELLYSTGTTTYGHLAAGSSNQVLISGGAGAPSWSTIGGSNVTNDSLDFAQFEDTLDLDAALTLNQTTYTWGQTYTGTAGAGLTYTASGAVTSGNAAALDINVSNASTSVPAMMLTNAGSTFALRVNDDGTTTDSTPFVIDASGQVGVGTTTPSYKMDIRGPASAFDIITDSLVLMGGAGVTTTPFINHTPYTNVSGGLGTNGTLRLTSQGNLLNIGKYQGGEMLLTSGGTIGAATTISIGGGLREPAYGDLNGDGYPDLAIIRESGNLVYVYFNNGSGTFSLSNSYSTGFGPYYAIIKDIDGDGKNDVVTANNSGASVSVLTNTGTGTLNAKVDYTVGSAPAGLDIGDVNGDGKPDIVAAGSTSATVSVLTNTGTGTFNTKVDYATATTPYIPTLGDVNKDGYLDIVLPNMGSNSVSVFLNNGNGTFATKVDYATQEKPMKAKIIDVNGNNIPDLVVKTSYTGSDGYISVLMGNGDGTFATKVDYLAGYGNPGLDVADFNGDGFPDVVAAGSYDDKVSILLNNGDGTFATRVQYSTDDYPAYVSAPDVNKDGKPDVVVTNYTTGSVNIRLNTTSTIFYAQASTGRVGIGDASPASALTVGNGDLFQVDTSGNIVKLNNVTTSFPGSQGAANTVLLNNGSGTLSWTTLGASSITADSLDFTELQDTLDLDAALTLNQTTYTWGQTYTGTAGAGLTYTASGAVTSGNAAALDINVSNASTSVPAMMLTNAGSTFALRVNDDGTTTDSTPFVIDANGQVGIGTASPAQQLDVAGNMYFSGAARTISSNSNLTISPGRLLTLKSTADPILFSPGGTERMELLLSGGLAFGGTYYGTDPGANNAIFEGTVGIGTTGADSKLDVLSASGAQIRATYTDGSVYTTFTTDSSGNMTVDATGTKTIVADDLQVSGGDILDSNGNEEITFGVTGSAVNNLSITNAATGTGGPTIGVAGETNVNLNINSAGTGAIVFGSANATGTTTSSNFVFNANSLTTGTAMYLNSSSITQGKLLDINTGSANTLTTGTLLNVATTSTALSTGTLGKFDWSPTGSTTIYATGDLVSINAGQYASVGNLLNIMDNSSSVFSVSQTAVTSALPTSFTAPGDVSIAYDLQFTNPSASYIKSQSSMYLQAGENFGASDLGLNVYNEGSVIVNQDNQPTAAATSYAFQVLPALTSSTNSMTYNAMYGQYTLPTVNLTGDAATDLTTAYGNYTGLTATAGTIGTWYGNYIAAPTGSGTVSTSYGLEVAALSNATSYGVDIGALSGATANYGLNIGAMTSAATANNFSIKTGQITSQASATSYGISTGGFAAGAGTATYGINIGANASTATTNYGMNIGAVSGAGTTNYGLYVGTVSGASNNYAAIFAGGNVGIGDTAPATKLSLSTSTSLDGAVFTDGTRWTRLMPGTTGSGSYNGITQTNDNAIIYSAGSQNTGGFVIAPWSNTTNGLRMDNAGKIGIGTHTPGGTLDVTNATITNAGKLVNLAGTTTTSTASGTAYGLYNSFTNANTTNADTAYGIYNTQADATALANTNYGFYGTLALSGNAAKTGYGMYSTVTSSSTTADTIGALNLATSETGVMTTGTRTIYGLLSQPASTAVDTGGTTNIYGGYFAPSATLANGSTQNVFGGYIAGTATVASGTINRYGLYIDTASMNTTGTSTQYGLYVNTPIGADTNYAAIFAGGNVGIGTTTPSTSLYIKTDTGITIRESGDNYGGLIIPNNTYPTNGGLVIRSRGNGGSGLALMSDENKGLVLIPGRNTIPTVSTFSVGSVHILAADVSTDILRWYNYLGTQLGAIDANGNVGINDTSPEAQLDIDSSATTTNIFGILSTTLTTGNAIDLTTTYVDATGGTDSAIDINLTNTPTTNANTLQGLDLSITDSTALASTLYGTIVSVDNSGNTATGTHTIYGGSFTATGKTAGTTTAIGGYFSASGADTNNAIVVGAGTVQLPGATNTAVINFSDSTTSGFGERASGQPAVYSSGTIIGVWGGNLGSSGPNPSSLGMVVGPVNTTSGIIAFDTTGGGAPKSYIGANGSGLNIYGKDSATNTTLDLFTLYHDSSDTPTNSFGSGIAFKAKSSTTAGQDMANISSIWTDATHATRTSALTFSTVNSAAAIAEVMRIQGNGNVGIGDTGPDSPLEVLSTSTQFRLSYADGTDTTFGVNNVGDLTITPSGADVSIGGNINWDAFGRKIQTGGTYIEWASGTGNLNLNNSTEVNASIVLTSHTGGYVELMGGNVGINDTTPDFTLDVEKASTTVAQFNRLTDDGTIVSLAQDGTEEGTISVSGNTVSYNAFTGSHYAWSDTSETLTKGTLVTLTGSNKRFHNNTDSEIMYGIEASTVANDPNILGSYLSIQEPSKAEDTENPSLVMAAGNGEVWIVEGENGDDVTRGDYLISSDVKGHAMVDPGTFAAAHIFAKAAENIDWNKVSDTVKDPQGNSRKHARITVFFEASKYSPAQTLVQNQPQTVDLSTYYTASQTDAKLASLQSQLDFLLTQSTQSASTKESTESVTLSLSLPTLDIEQLLRVLGDLKVTGKTTLADTNIAGKLAMGTLSFSDVDGSINSIGALKLQNEYGSETIDAFNGKIILDKDGNITVKNINTETITLKAGKSSGSATLKAGETEIKVTTGTDTSNSQILCTFTTKTGKILYVSSKDSDGFKVGIENAATEDLDFDWLIIYNSN